MATAPPDADPAAGGRRWLPAEHGGSRATDGTTGSGPPERVREITLGNTLDWMRRTRRHDLRTYRKKRRPMSLRRLVHAVRPDLQRPVLIVGAARSGTTFLGDCIAALPTLSYHHEPVLTKAVGRHVHEGLWSERRCRFVFRTTYAWLMRLHLDGDLRFAEKTPTNSVLIPFLDRTFRDARFVHIVRDGRDAALSYSRLPWLQAASRGSGKVEAGGYPNGPYARFWVEPERRAEFEATSDLHRCIWAWRVQTEAALRDGAALGPARYHELRYEDLMSAPAREADRLLAFLELGDAASRGALHAAVAAADPRSVGGWKRELSLEDVATIEREAGQLLRRLGYDAGPESSDPR